MRKTASFFLALLLAAWLLLPAASQAAGGKFGADVTVNGTTRFLQWEKMNVRNGKLVVTVSGFGREKGKNVGELSVIVGGQEKRPKKQQDDGKGNCVYTFESTALPEAILFYPADGGETVLLWRDGESGYGIPETHTGKWKGTATPEDGSPEFTVTLSLAFDGTGEYKYMREETGAMVPFTVRLNNWAFYADVTADIVPVEKLEGTQTLQRGTLLLKVTAFLRNGEKEDFTVKLKKVREEEEQD